MKKVALLTLILALAALGCAPRKESSARLETGTPAYQLAKDLNGVLPIFDPEKNSVLISTSKFDVTVADIVEIFLKSMGSQASQIRSLDAPRLEGVVAQAASQLAERKLLLAAAKESRITATAEDIQSGLNAQYDQVGGETQFQEMLKTNGIGFDYVKKTVAEDLVIRKYIERTLTANIRVTAAEIQKAYDADKSASVRHILLLTQGKSESEKTAIREKMKGILARAKNGEDFAGLAKQFSEDPGSKDGGGLYQDVTRGRMVKPFEDAAFGVPVGEISDIVETSYGYHILRVEERKKESEPLEQAKAELESQIKERKLPAAFESHLAELKTKAKYAALKIKP